MISKLPNLAPSIFSVMSKMANDYNAINLSQGFPNFNSDPALIELVCKAMKDGHNQYAPMPGILALREVIAQKFATLYNSNYNPETEITVTAGATQAIYTAITAVIETGDEVLIFKPAYDCYEPAIKLCGGVSVPIQLKAPDYKVDWNEVAQKVSDKTKMILINTPHNPSGTIFSETDMQQLEQLVENTDCIVLSDEVYEHIIFDGKQHNSVAKYPGLAKRSFITASFGKTFHNTGWKMGYCVAPEWLMKEFRKVHEFNVFSVNHPIQKALSEYLKNPNTYLSLSGFYQEKRDTFLSLIKDSRFRFSASSGTYFQLLDFSEITDENDIVFAERLTKEYKLASVPTSVFNKNKEDHKMLRFCFAKTNETLEAAAKILNSI